MSGSILFAIAVIEESITSQVIDSVCLRQTRTGPSAKTPKMVLLILMILFCHTETFAQESRAAVRLDGRVLFRVGASESEDASERARQIERRLMAALQNPVSANAPRVTRVDEDLGKLSIVLAGRQILSVSPVDAEKNGVSLEALATEWANLIATGLAEASGRRGSAPERFLIAVRSGIETAFARLLDSALVIIPRALAAMLVLAMFWLLAIAVKHAMRLIFRWFVADLTVENLVKQVGYYSVWAVGLLVAANAYGLEAETFATGLGLTSLALGFALKDILSNFVSGLLILTLRPFELGDQIIIGETEGTVEQIQLRATLIRTYDGRSVAVPNAETFTSRVTNNTASPIRRAGVQVYLGYETDVRQAMTALLQAAQEVETVLDDPPSTVRVQSLGQEEMVLEVTFWTDSRRSDFTSTASAVRVAAVDHMRARGIEMPSGKIDLILPDRTNASSA